MHKIVHETSDVFMLVLLFSLAGFIAVDKITFIHHKKITLCKFSLRKDSISYKWQTLLGNFYEETCIVNKCYTDTVKHT